MNGFQIVWYFIKTHFMTDLQKDFEILALRSQLSVLQQHIINHKITKPRANNCFRILWIFLLKFFLNWKSVLILFKPETVIGWHKRAFKFYWKLKSKGGRPKISRTTIALIKRIHKENPTLSLEKIYEQLISLNITDVPAPNTIAKYICCKHKPPTENQKQSWKSFLSNHAKNIWAMDFVVVPTLTFKVFYVLLIINHSRRKIEHFAVTDHPCARWVKQQLRNSMPFEKQPKYIIHDNDSMFKNNLLQKFLLNLHIKSKNITPYSPWQNGICERLIGTVRRELFDHIIPLNQNHFEGLLKEYVYYYNNVRTHQTLDGKTPILKLISPPKTKVKDTILSTKPILGGLYHEYEKTA